MSSIPPLDLTPQITALRDQFLAAISGVLDTTAFINGPDVKAFEEEVASYLGVQHAIGVNSGTDALVLGLRAMNIGPGDEVITTPFSFFATAESILNVGAKPVFVDIEEDSFNLDASKVEGAITSATKAILPVHLYGRPADMTAIKRVADAHGLQILEDCAQSIGAVCGGQQTGTIGRVGAFSFFPSKNLGAFGDGGLVVTDDDELALTVRKLKSHGGINKYRNELVGYNSRLDSIQAAILRVKLPHLDSWSEGRRAAATRYTAMLSGVEGVVAPDVTDGHVFHQYTTRIVGADRDAVQSGMSERGVTCMVYYPVPQDELPVLAGQYPVLPTSKRLGAQVLSLPIWPEIDESTQRRVVDSLKEVLDEQRTAAG